MCILVAITQPLLRYEGYCFILLSMHAQSGGAVIEKKKKKHRQIILECEVHLKKRRKQPKQILAATNNAHILFFPDNSKEMTMIQYTLKI